MMYDKEWITQLEEAGVIKNGAIFLSASEVDKLLGYSKFESPYEFIQRKLAKETIPPNEFTTAGQKMEPIIISNAIKDLGLTPVDKDSWQQYKKVLVGNVDGYDIYIGGKVDALVEKMDFINNDMLVKKYILEVKYMPSHKSISFNGDIPDWYKYQVLSYMFMFGRNAIFYALMSDGFYYVEKYLLNEKNNIKIFVEEIKESVKRLLTGEIMNFTNRNISSNKNIVYKEIAKDNIKEQLDRLIAQYVKLHQEYEPIIEEYKKFEKEKEKIVKSIKNILGDDVDYVLKYDNYEVSIQNRLFTNINRDKIIEELGEEVFKKYVDEKTYKYIQAKKISPNIL
ncbi:MAG: hypothetical protein QXF12_00595 [Candidatus Aenigmatarchaeota archaeon]